MLNNDDMWTEVELDNQPSARRNQAMTFLASRTANRPDSGMGKGTWSNRYDARGNRIADAEFEYQYNAADRLVAIFDRETQQELMRSVYDGTGKRVNVSETGGSSMWTMYDGEVPIIERSDDGSIALHVYADGLHIARLTMPGSKDATDDPPGVEYYHSDHLGSPRLMTDQAGDVVWPTGKGASYWAYGGVMEDLAGDTEANRWRFTGKPEDQTTGHHYFNARYLSESTKYNAPQFMSPDPVLGNVADPRSWNRYAYCLGNPVMYIDLDGQEITFFNDASRDLFLKYLKEIIVKEYSNLVQQWFRLKWSNIEYEIRLDGTPPSQTSEGLTYAFGNQNTNKIVVQVYDTGMTNKRQQISTLGHELRHALQFERGQLAFAYSGNDEEPWQPRYYSNAHEVDAFMAQALISGGTMYTKWHVTNTTFQQRLSLLPASYSSRSGGSLNYLPSFLPSIQGTNRAEVNSGYGMEHLLWHHPVEGNKPMQMYDPWE